MTFVWFSLRKFLKIQHFLYENSEIKWDLKPNLRYHLKKQVLKATGNLITQNLSTVYGLPLKKEGGE